MDYGPEIAVLHGTFALVERERVSGKIDLLQHIKGARSERLFLLIKAVIKEVSVEGLEKPLSQQERQYWSRHLHHIFFCKAFVFNSHFVHRATDEEKLSGSLKHFKNVCAPIPDIHPHLYFELSDEFGWSEFLGEMLALVDFPTALDFVSSCLTFCSPEPSLLYDLSIISTVLDFLVSAHLMELLHQSHWHTDTAVMASPSAAFARRLDETTENAEVLNVNTKAKTTNEKTGENGDDSNEKAGGKIVKNKMDGNADDLNNKTESNGVESNTGHHVDDFKEENKRKATEKADESNAATDQLKLKALVQLDEQLRDNLARMVTMTAEILSLVQKRMSTKLFDRNTCKSGAMANVLHVLGHILASTIVFSVISFSSLQGQDLRDFLMMLMVKDEDHDGQTDTCSNGNDTNILKHDSESNHHTLDSENRSLVNGVTEALNEMVRDAQVKKACLKCMSSFFAAQSTPGSTLQKLSLEKSVKFGRVLKLNLKLCLMTKPLKTLKVTPELVTLLAGWFEEEKEEAPVRLTDCISAILKELQRREVLAEERRMNPSLRDVMTTIQKKLPRWKWCLQFGLAKRDVKGWWLSGFLELLCKDHVLLNKESDVKHLLSVLTEIANLAKCEPNEWDLSLNMCTELLLKVFSQLSGADQEKIILSVYTETAESYALQWTHRTNIEQLLTVTFNKLSASTTPKDLQATLQLALYSPMTFTRHAVLTAISSQGQIQVVTKLLQLAPGVMKILHPKHHPEQSLLCTCLQNMLTDLNLNPTEQKNVLNLVSLLVQSYKTDVRQPPLLSASEFLVSCILPYISTENSHPPVSIQFALRLLIGCLEATLSDKNSGWLEDIYTAVIVACCARILQDSMNLVSKIDAEGDTAIETKSLVLQVLDNLQKHFYTVEKVFEGHDLSWLQAKCAEFDWTVSTYLCEFLSPTLETGENLLLEEFAASAVQQAPQNPVALLRLSATSDASADQVMRALQQQQAQHALITEAALLGALCQVLPNLLVSEMKRLVQVLSFLSSRKLVEVCYREVTHDVPLSEDFTDWHNEVMISQILMDTAILVVTCHSHLTSGVFHHIAQVLVVALQTLLQSIEHRNKPATFQQSAFHHIFHHICVIMSISHDSMLEPLFVVVLDLVTRLTQQAASSGSPLLSGSLREGIQLISKESLREAVTKKLEN